MKILVKLDNYCLPEYLKKLPKEFVIYYNNKRYHECFDNLTLANVCYDLPGLVLLCLKTFTADFQVLLTSFAETTLPIYLEQQVFIYKFRKFQRYYAQVEMPVKILIVLRIEA